MLFPVPGWRNSAISKYNRQKTYWASSVWSKLQFIAQDKVQFTRYKRLKVIMAVGINAIKQKIKRMWLVFVAIVFNYIKIYIVSISRYPCNFMCLDILRKFEFLTARCLVFWKQFPAAGYQEDKMFLELLDIELLKQLIRYSTVS